MDPQLEEIYGSLYQIKFSDQKGPILSNHNFVNALKLLDSNLNSSFANPQLIPPNSNSSLVVQSLCPDIEGPILEDLDLSDVIRKYIYQVLMEEDKGEKTRLNHQPSALEATEKSLYEALGQKYPPSQNQSYLPNMKFGSVNENGVSSCFGYSSNGGSSLGQHNWSGYPFVFNPRHVVDFPVSSLKPSSKTSNNSVHSSSGQADVLQLNLELSFSSRSNASCLVDWPGDSPVSTLSASDIFTDNRSILRFKNGIEEAKKSLPNDSPYVELVSRTKHRPPKVFQPEEGRISKQLAVSLVSDESDVRSEIFDKVLLSSKGKHDAALREAFQSELNRNFQNDQAQGSNGGKGRGKNTKREVVALRTLLSLCAQAVASDDQRSAIDLLRQIRQHSSPIGDGN